MNELQKLYDVLKRDGYYTKSFEEFQTKWQDKEYQDKVYGVVSRDKLYTKSKDEFLSKYSSQQEPLKKKTLPFRIPNWKNLHRFLIPNKLSLRLM
jgi:hypothetical protein